MAEGIQEQLCPVLVKCEGHKDQQSPGAHRSSHQQRSAGRLAAAPSALFWLARDAFSDADLKLLGWALIFWIYSTHISVSFNTRGHRHRASIWSFVCLDFISKMNVFIEWTPKLYGNLLSLSSSSESVKSVIGISWNEQAELKLEWMPNYYRM